METQTAEPRPRPTWVVKFMAAKREGLASLTPEELAEAEATKAERKARVEARRLASIERAKTICAMFFDGRSDVEIAAAIGRKSRVVRRFSELCGFTITRSKTSVRRLVAISRDHEMQLRSLAERNGMTAASALDLIVSVAFRDDGLLARCILRNEEAVRGAVKHAFITATYPPAVRAPEPIHVRD